jgi:hypothetical protein
MSTAIGILGVTLIVIGAVGVMVYILGFLVSALISFPIAVVEDVRSHFGNRRPSTTGLGRPVLHS